MVVGEGWQNQRSDTFPRVFLSWARTLCYKRSNWGLKWEGDGRSPRVTSCYSHRLKITSNEGIKNFLFLKYISTGV